MDEIRLTKDSDALICAIYKEYLERRKVGIPKYDAKFFDGSSYVHEKLMPDWSFDDVDETCRELSRSDLLNCLVADDVVCAASISDFGIIYMENRFKDGLGSVLGYLERLRSILPL